MHQALINELRACEVKIRVELNKGEIDVDEWWELKSQLLAAQASCLNGIAVLVAARGK